MAMRPNYTPGDLKDHDAIAAIIKDDNDNLLMFFHQKFQCWTIPIGKAEPGQTPYEGMRTELQEECGIVVTQASEIAVEELRYIRHGSPVRVMLHLYEIHAFDGTLVNNEPKTFDNAIYATRTGTCRKEPFRCDPTLFKTPS